MPLKQKWIPLPTAYPSAIRKSSGITRTQYHQGCSLNPSGDVIVTPWDSTTGLLVGETPINNMGFGEWILYGNSKFRSFNLCHHLKQTNTISGQGIRLYRDLSGSFQNDCDADSVANGISTTVDGLEECYIRTERLLGDSLIPIIIGWDPYLPIESPLFAQKTLILDRMALDEMIPKLDDGFSLPVFIAELKDLRGMIREMWEVFAHFPDKLKRLFNRPLREMSQSWLSAVLGWLPFVSDIQTLVSKLWNMDQIIFDYMSKANQRMTLHYQKGLSPYTFQDPSWFESDGGIVIDAAEDPTYYFAYPAFSRVGVSSKTRRTVSDLKFHATLDFTYYVPIIETLDAQSAALRAMCMSLGIKPSLRDIWEEVPFSFVVDWFLGIGSWLKQFDVDLLPASVVVHDYCRSYRYRLVQETTCTEVGLFVPPNSSQAQPGWLASPSSDVASTEVTSFYRLPGVPVPSSSQLPNWRTPKGLQWVTGAALAYTRRRKRRHVHAKP